MRHLSSNNPTTNIDLYFNNYLQVREREIDSRLVGGIPNYSFSWDYKLRQQLAALSPVRQIAKSLVSMATPIWRQIHQMEAVAVGTQQYPEIHAMGEECARRLGIGVPQIFITSSPIINAYTMASDDVEPVVVLSSAIVEALTLEELKFVIGHECGHIHNLHGAYNTVAWLITDKMAKVVDSIPGLGLLLWPLIVGGSGLFFKRWSRCAEITCDRAGLICCGDLHTAQMALAKLATGEVNKLGKINLEEYIKQISQVQATPISLLELNRSHPLTHKRIEALNLFAKCDVLSTWREEMAIDNPLRRSKIDRRCEQFIKVLSTK